MEYLVVSIVIVHLLNGLLLLIAMTKDFGEHHKDVWLIMVRVALTLWWLLQFENLLNSSDVNHYTGKSLSIGILFMSALTALNLFFYKRKQKENER